MYIAQLTQAVEYDDCISAPMSVLDMTPYSIGVWGSCPGALAKVENLFIIISPRSSLTQMNSTC